MLLFAVYRTLSPANSHLYALIWGKHKAWNASRYERGGPQNLQANCKEIVTKDIAVVYIQISSETFIRTIRDRKVTFAGRIATLGNQQPKTKKYKVKGS